MDQEEASSANVNSQVNLEQILDIQLTLNEAMLRFALGAKASPAGSGGPAG